MNPTFNWLSPLGLSSAFFLGIGILWILIGALTVPLLGKSTGSEMIFVSHSTDTAYFGKTPSDLLGADPALGKLRTLLLTVIAGFLLLSGTLVVLLTWFGLRARQPWSLAALSLGIVLAVALWAVALLPYLRSGIRVTLGDLPPFMWVPAMLIVPATIFGWVGLGGA